MKFKCKTMVKIFVSLLIAFICIGFFSTKVKATDGIKLIWPVPGYEGNISQHLHANNGIDISCEGIDGAYVCAAEGGKVVAKFECNDNHPGMDEGCPNGCYGFGNGVVIYNPTNHRIYQYAHMQAGSIPADVYKDSIVKPGQIIGKVGSTGSSTGPHLHFGICIKPENANNYPWTLNSGIDPEYEDYSLLDLDVKINPDYDKSQISWNAIEGATKYRLARKRQ